MTYQEQPITNVASIAEPDAQLIDVREPNEVAGGSLAGAVNIPLGEIPSRIHELDPQRQVLLVCRSGARSANAARYLAASGFSNVINLTGGLLAYAQTSAKD